MTKIWVEMRPRRIRPIHHGQSCEGKSIPDPNRTSQTNAANETGQETQTKVLKKGNLLVRIDPQPASFKNRGEKSMEMTHCFVKRS